MFGNYPLSFNIVFYLIVIFSWLSKHTHKGIHMSSREEKIEENSLTYQEWKIPLNLHREEYPSENRKINLIWVLIRSNSIDLMIGLLVESWSTVVGFVSTYAIKRILDGLSFGDRAIAFKFAILHFLCNMSFAQFDLCGKWHSRYIFLISLPDSRGFIYSLWQRFSI
jgi:hypothetical protein